MPAVTDPPSPNGLPAATTQSPTSNARLSPQLTAGSRADGITLITAISVSSSAPTSRAGSWVPSDRLTTMVSALPTTWLLVTMMPPGSIMNPEPAPITWRFCCRSRNWRCNCGGNNASGSRCGTVSVVAMFTTDGSTCLTNGAKLSGPLRAKAGKAGISSAEASNRRRVGNGMRKLQATLVCLCGDARSATQVVRRQTQIVLFVHKKKTYPYL